MKTQPKQPGAKGSQLSLFRRFPSISFLRFRKYFFRFISYIVLVTFTTTQIAWGYDRLPSDPAQIQSKSIEEVQAPAVEKNEPESFQGSLKFLEETNVLSAAAEANPANSEKKSLDSIISLLQTPLEGDPGDPEDAVAHAKEQLIQGFDLSDEDAQEALKDIQVVSIEARTGSQPCGPLVNCAMARITSHEIVLELYGNRYEFWAGKLNTAKEAAVLAVNQLMKEGTPRCPRCNPVVHPKLSEIQIGNIEPSGMWSYEVDLEVRFGPSFRRKPSIAWRYPVDFQGYFSGSAVGEREFLPQHSSPHGSEYYTVDQAIDLFSPDYAAAVVLEDLTETDIQKLLDLPFEVGIAVLEGEIVVFTTGNEDEIGILEPARKLLENAAFISHTHVTSFSQDGPSPFDLQHAVQSPEAEFVLTKNGVYVYNTEGLKHTISLQDYRFNLYLSRSIARSPKQIPWYDLDPFETPGGSFDSRINKALSVVPRNMTMVREKLNEFIYQMDRYNEFSEAEREIFRKAATPDFFDDFNRPQIGANWTVHEAWFSIKDNAQLYQGGSWPNVVNGLITLNVPLGSEDYEAQAGFQFGSSSTPRGIVLRFQDSQNYYYGRITNYNSAKIIKVENGVATDLATQSISGLAAWSWHTIKMKAEGDHLELYLDGNLVAQADDATFSSGTVGIKSEAYNLRFDNFSVTTLGSVPPDTTAPVISAVSASSITATGAVISWTTDEASDSQVEYRIQGTSTWTPTAVDTSMVTSHSVTLSGLSASTVYEYRVKSRDAAGNLATQATVSNFTTPAPPDTTAPVISGVSTSGLTFDGVTINWDTDEASDTQIEYGLTSSYGSSTTLDAALVTNHSQSLTGLSGSSLYHYRVKSRDAAGNLQVSPDFTFTTPAPPDTTAPVISAVSASSITATGAVISWTTDEASDSQVEYRIQGTSTWTPTAVDTSMVTSHSVTLSGLSASTVYEYRVKSKDAAGNLATQSPPSSFTTLAPPGTPVTIVDDFNDGVLGPDWTIRTGNFTINAAGQLYHSGNSPNSLMTYNGALASDDYEVQVDFDFGGSADWRGLVFRYVDSQNYYYARVSRFGNYQIKKVEAGVSTTLSSTSSSWHGAGSWHTLKVVVEGSHMELWLDGNFKILADDTIHTTGTVGIYSEIYSRKFDNFSLTMLNVAPPPPSPTPAASASQAEVVIGDLTAGQSQFSIQLLENADPNIAKISYSTDGGNTYSALEAASGTLQAAISEEEGLSALDIRFHDASDAVLSSEKVVYSLTALRQAQSLDASVTGKSIHNLVREGLLRTDKYGNILALYNRNLITTLDHGATLPQMSVQFSAQDMADLDMGVDFILPTEFVAGKAAQGSARLVIENGEMKLKIKQPAQDEIDGVSFLRDVETAVLSKMDLELDQIYEVQFDFTLEGLAVYLEKNEVRMHSEPVYVIAGAQAASELIKTSETNVTIASEVIYADTDDVLLGSGEHHAFTRAVDLSLITDTVTWEKYENIEINDTTYQIKQSFDASGRLTQFEDRNGNTIQYAYDAQDRVTSVVNSAAGVSQTVTYQTAGISDTEMTTAASYVDGFGNNINTVTKEVFDDQARRIRQEFSNGKIVDYAYGSLVSASVSEAGQAYNVTAAFDSQGRITAMTDRRGIAEQRSYTILVNGNEQLDITRTIPGTPSDFIQTEQIITDREGRLVHTLDASGNTTDAVYDGSEILSFTDTEGRVTTYVYQKGEAGQIDQITETLAYTDDFGNNINAVTQSRFDAYGNLLAQIAPNGDAVVHDFEFYGFNHLLKKQTPHLYFGQTDLTALLSNHPASTPVTSITEWDERGRVIRTVEFNGVETLIDFDEDIKGNVIQQRTSTNFTDSSGSYSADEIREFDLRGRLIKITDQNGNETLLQYDNLGNLTSQIFHYAGQPAALDRTTVFTDVRSPQGVLQERHQTTTFTDGFGNSIRQSLLQKFDLFGRLTHEVRPDGSAQLIAYGDDGNGNLISQTIYRYFEIDDLAALDLAHTTPSQDREVSTFNALGELVSIQGFDEKTTSYSQTKYSNGLVQSETAATTWTTPDNVNASITETTEFDMDGRVIKVTDRYGDVTDYIYGVKGALTEIQKTVTYESANHIQTTTLNEVRNTAGILTERSTAIAGEDSFGNIFTKETIETYDNNRRLTARIDETGLGQIIEYSLTAWNEINEQRIYEYEGINTLTELNAEHAAGPALESRTTYNELGEAVETENKDGLVTQITRERYAAGAVSKETTTLIETGLADRVSSVEFDAEGRVIKQTSERGVENTRALGHDGSVLSMTLTSVGDASHSIVHLMGYLPHANGTENKATRTTTGTDQYGRTLDRFAATEVNGLGDLEIEITEANAGKFYEYTRDDRNRIIEIKEHQLLDGDGYLASISSGETHLTLQMVRDWFSSQPAGFEAKTVIKTFDSNGELIKTVAQGKQTEITGIISNPLGGPAEITKVKHFALSEDTDAFDFEAEIETFVGDSDLPRVTINGTNEDLTGMGSAGVAVIVLPAGSVTGKTKTLYSSSEMSALENDLDNFAPGDVILIVTRGDLSAVISSTLLITLQHDFGMSKAEGLKLGGAYAGIGLKGSEPGDAIESYKFDTSEQVKAVNFYRSVETYNTRGYLLQYENGYDSTYEYMRGFDGEALGLTETTDNGRTVKTTQFQKTRDTKGRVTSGQDNTQTVNTHDFSSPAQFPSDWRITGEGHSITGGMMEVEPVDASWFAGIYYPGPGDALSLNLDFEWINNTDGELLILFRFNSYTDYFGIRLTSTGADVIKRNGLEEVSLYHVDLTPALLADQNHSVQASFADDRVSLVIGTTTLISAYSVDPAENITQSGQLALGVEHGKLGFTQVSAVHEITRSRSFGEVEILATRTDANGVTRTYGTDGELMKEEDPANGITKDYETERYADGTLKMRKQMLTLTALDVEGVQTTTVLETENHYDEQGRITKSMDTTGAAADYTYTAAGEIDTVIFSDGRKIQYQYTPDAATGNRTVTEIHSQARQDDLGDFLLDGSSELIYDETARSSQTHDKDGALVAAQENRIEDNIHEDQTVSYEYYPGEEKKVSRKEIQHVFYDTSQNPEAVILSYTTYEEFDEEGLVTESLDENGVKRVTTYREIVREGGEDNPKRIYTIEETDGGDITKHYYFYESSNTHAGLAHPPSEYHDLDGDETEAGRDDLDFVIQVKENADAGAQDDEVVLVKYSGDAGSERIEKQIIFAPGGMTTKQRESGFIYHFDGQLDQVMAYVYDTEYDPVQQKVVGLDTKRLESTTTYKINPGNGESQIDKITDAFKIKNHFYTPNGRLERVEEVNGAYPKRVTTSYYDSFGDIVEVKDVYGRSSYFEYVKDSMTGKTTAIIETKFSPDEDLSGYRAIRYVDSNQETVAEIDTNGYVKVIERTDHPTGLGRIEKEIEFSLDDGNGWLTPWQHAVPAAWSEIQAAFDQDSDGVLEASDIETLAGVVGISQNLVKRERIKVMNRQGDIMMSLSPEGQLSIYEYEVDILEAKKQTQYFFYKPDTELGYKRIDAVEITVGSAAWDTLMTQLLEASDQDYQEVASAERDNFRSQLYQDRWDAAAAFFLSEGAVTDLGDLSMVSIARRHNSDGNLIEEREQNGIVRNYVYTRDEYGLPVESFATEADTDFVSHQKFNVDGEVVEQRLSNGLIRTFSYVKDNKGNITQVIESTIYPHDPTGPGSVEIRDWDLQGEVLKITDKNGIVTDITNRTNAIGEKEIERHIHYLDPYFSAAGEVSFTEIERKNASGNTVYRKDKNDREAVSAVTYTSEGLVDEITETVSYVTGDGQAIAYDQNFKFNTLGEQIQATDKNGKVTEFEYTKDSFGNTVAVKETEHFLSSSATATKWRYLNTLGQTTGTVDKNGFRTEIVYEKDALGNVTRSYETQKLYHDFTNDGKVDDLDLEFLESKFGDTDLTLAEIVAFAVAYPHLGTIARLDLNGDEWIDSKDTDLLMQSREYGTVEVATARNYSVFGDILSIEDPRQLAGDETGKTLFYDYVKDSKGNLVKSMETNNRFLGEIVRYFDTDTRITAMVDAQGNVVRYDYEYDALGNLKNSTEYQQVRVPEEVNESAKHTDPVNLAPNAVVTTSASLTESGHPRSNLTDGIVGSSGNIWFSQRQAYGTEDKEFVLLDLGELQTLYEVRVDNTAQFSDYFTRAFDVSVSVDGFNWIKVGGKTNLAHQGMQTVAFDGIDARYVKLHNFTSRNDGGAPYHVILAEVEVYTYDLIVEDVTSYPENGLNVIEVTEDNVLVSKTKTDNQGRLVYEKLLDGGLTVTEFEWVFEDISNPRTEQKLDLQNGSQLVYEKKYDLQGRLISYEEGSTHEEYDYVTQNIGGENVLVMESFNLVGGVRGQDPFERAVLEEIKDVEGLVIRTDKHVLTAGDIVTHIEIDESPYLGKDYEEIHAPLDIVLARNESGRYAERAIDGLYGQAVFTKAAGPNGVILELEEPQAIGSMDLYLDRTLMTAYEVFVSMNAVNWHRVVDKTDQFRTGLQQLEFPGVIAKYVKVTGITENPVSNPEWKMEEVRLYSPRYWPAESRVEREFDPVSGDVLSEYQAGAKMETFVFEKDEKENILKITTRHYDQDQLVKVVKTKNSAGTDQSTALVDGSRETGLSNTNASGAYFQFELDEIREIEEVRFLLGDSNANEYSTWIDVSVDGTAWMRVYEHPAADERSWQRVQFSAAAAKFVRIGGGEKTNPGFFNLNEVKIIPAKDAVLEYETARITGDIASSETSKHEVAAQGDPKIVTDANAQVTGNPDDFGGSAGRFDGDDHLTVADHEDFNFGAGDFTMDTWIRLDGLSQTHIIAEKFTGGTSGYSWYVSADGYMTFYDSGFQVNSASPVITAGEWTHLAIAREAGNWRMFVNGIEVGYNTGTQAISNVVSDFRIGSRNGVCPECLKGYLDEFRVTKGVARWTSNFNTVLPSRDEPRDENTVLLLHFDGSDGSSRFLDGGRQILSFSRNGETTQTIDRDGRKTRYSYTYDEYGFRTGTFLAKETSQGLLFSSNEVDEFGRVVRQTTDTGEVSYFDYEVDEYGNIKKAYIRNTEPEEVTIQRNLMNLIGDVSISGAGWNGIRFNTSTQTNSLFDGNNATRGSLTWTDPSGIVPLYFNFSNAKHVLNYGGASHANDASAFGASAASFDGGNDTLTVDGDLDFDLAGNDFTMEARIKLDSYHDYQIIAEKFSGATQGYTWYVTPNGALVFYGAGGALQLGTDLGVIPIGQWVHVAVTRSGDVWTLYVNGEAQELPNPVIPTGVSLSDEAADFRIGSRNGITHFFDGEMDEFRVSRGIARDFSGAAPAQPYEPDDYTVLLMHFDGAPGSTDFTDDSVDPAEIKTVDLSEVRLRPYNTSGYLGYAIDVLDKNGVWHRVADELEGVAASRWREHEFDVQDAVMVRLTPAGNSEFQIDEIQIFGDKQTVKNYQIVREYDSRGNVISETNVLYDIWQSRPDLQKLFPDPQKQALAGRFAAQPSTDSANTIVGWAREIGYLEDPRLDAYTGRLDVITEPLKVSFDTRRDLQNRFVDQTQLVDWAKKQAAISPEFLASYDSAHVQSSTAAQGDSTILGAPPIYTQQGTPVVTVTPDVLLSAGKSVKATSSASGASTDAWKALDGDPATKWLGNASLEGNVFEIDLWEVSKVNKVILHDGYNGSNDYLASFRVETSVDGIEWTEVAAASGGPPAANQPWELSFNEIDARYVRISGIDPRNASGTPIATEFINEIKVYGDIETTTYEVYENGLLVQETGETGRTVYEYNGSGQLIRKTIYGPDVREWEKLEIDTAGSNWPEITDGNESNSKTITWTSSADPAAFTFQLEEPSTVDKLRIKTDGTITSPARYSVQASIDGVTWFDIVDRTSAGGYGWTEDYFPPVEAQYFKITGHLSPTLTRALTVYEVELFEETAENAPVSVITYGMQGFPVDTTNALMEIWKATPRLRTLYPDPFSASLVTWAQQEGYKQYHALQDYASAGHSERLPGLAQFLDDYRSLQERFRQDGDKNSGLIQYARETGYREDYRLIHYGKQKASEEMPSYYTFDSRLDSAGNQSEIILSDDTGFRVWRKFDVDGRVVEQKEELTLLWEETPELYQSKTTSGALLSWAQTTGYKDARYAGALVDYPTETIGANITEGPFITRSQYVFDANGYQTQLLEDTYRLEGTKAYTTTTSYDHDGYETSWSRPGYESPVYVNTKDKYGRVIQRTGSSEGTETFLSAQAAPNDLSLDVRRTQWIQNFLMTSGRLPSAEEIQNEIDFYLTQGAYASNLSLHMTALTWAAGFVPEQTVTGILDTSSGSVYGAIAALGIADISAAENAETTQRASGVKTGRDAAQAAEESSENKYLETLVQRVYRLVFGRDADETLAGQSSELMEARELFKTMNSRKEFEDSLRSQPEHSQRQADVQAMIDEVYQQWLIYFGLAHGTLNPSLAEVLKLLKIDPSFELTELTRDQIDAVKARLEDLKTEDLHFGNSAMTALQFILTEAYNNGVILSFPGSEGSTPPSLHDLTVQALFSDVLAGVLSPEFVGNLQFSAYTLKTIAESYGLRLDGYRLSWDELAAVTAQGKEVLVNIEDRHYVVITDIGCSVIASPQGEAISECTVTFQENGYTRTKTAEEFQARWFGIALLDGAEEVFKRQKDSSEFAGILTALQDGFAAGMNDGDFVIVTAADANNITYHGADGVSQTLSVAAFSALYSGWVFLSESELGLLSMAFDSNEALNADVRFVRVGGLVLALDQKNVLTTADLLKIKGAGFFSKYFKKLFKLFKKLLKAVVKFLKKVVAVINKALTKAFGKVIGGALGTLITGGISFLANTADYIAEGDFKGLFKYWGQIALQIAIQVVVAVVAPYLLGALFAVLGFLFQALGALVGTIGATIGQAVGAALGQGIGAAIGGAIQAGFQAVANVLTAVGKGIIDLTGRFLDKFGTLHDKTKPGFLNKFDISFGVKNIGTSLKAGITEFFKDPLGSIKGFGLKIGDILTNQVAGSVKSLFSSLSDGLSSLGQGLNQFLQWTAKGALDLGYKISQQLAQQKLDKELSKKKTNSLLRTFLSSSVGGLFTAFGDPVVAGLKGSLGTFIDTLVPRSELKEQPLNQTNQLTSAQIDDLTAKLKDGIDVENARQLDGDTRLVTGDDGIQYLVDSKGNIIDTLDNLLAGPGFSEDFRLLAGEQPTAFQAPAFQNYFYDPAFGPYDIFAPSNLQSQNPVLNGLFQGLNDLNNVSAFTLNAAVNAFGYTDALIDRITQTTPEQRLFLALQTPILYDDLFAGVEFGAVKLLALSQKFFGAKRPVAELKQFAYDARIARYRDLNTGRFVAQRNLPFPDDRGFIHSVKKELSVGTEIDRLGRLSGRFAGTPGSSISQRGLPSGSEVLPYSRFRVIKPFTAEAGPAAGVPEFRAVGGATQYYFEESLEDLIKKGFLERLI